MAAAGTAKGCCRIRTDPCCRHCCLSANRVASQHNAPRRAALVRMWRIIAPVIHTFICLSLIISRLFSTPYNLCICVRWHYIPRSDMAKNHKTKGNQQKAHKRKPLRGNFSRDSSTRLFHHSPGVKLTTFTRRTAYSSPLLAQRRGSQY